MLNLADFSSLLMIVVGPLCGVGAAHAHKAGGVSLAIFVLVGLAIGFGVAMASSKLAYSILNSKRFSAAVGLFFYSLVPIVGLFVVALTAAEQSGCGQRLVWHLSCQQRFPLAVA
jgi:hypothetical protein